MSRNEDVFGLAEFTGNRELADVILDRINEAVSIGEIQLNEWEENFVEDCGNPEKGITDRMLSKLRDIEEKYRL